MFYETLKSGAWRTKDEYMGGPRIDEIGPWSEVKLDILKRYAVEYSKILSNQKDPALFQFTLTHSQEPDFICRGPAVNGS